MDESNYGTMRQVDPSTFIWCIPNVLQPNRQCNNCQITSSHFSFEGALWYLKLFRSKMFPTVNTNFCLNQSLLGDPAPRTQIYRLSIRDVNGEKYWTSSVIEDKFREDEDFSGSPQFLRERDLLRDARRAFTTEGYLNVHLKFYPRGGEDNSSGARSNIGTQTCDLDELEGPNLKELLLSDYKSDPTLIAEGREFKAHQGNWLRFAKDWLRFALIPCSAICLFSLSAISYLWFYDVWI